MERSSRSKSLEDFCERNLKRVQRIAHYLTKDPFLAEEAAAEFFLRMCRMPMALDKINNERSWVYAALANVVRDLYRERNAFITHETLTDTVEQVQEACATTYALDPAQIVADAEAYARIRETLEQLPGLYRETALLKFRAGLKEREIARTLKCPLGTVKSRISKARELITRKIGKVEEAGGRETGHGKPEEPQGEF
jgi:RNA polymerase sigma-70 factor (ECF subfamily)